ncbi:peroxidase family protein [Neoaquamicrobium sediminum]|uniref:peroxidase family protein n=1 Tax=Neoaquamicrobium sediminum TaxID=1849104 RepID=UPI003BACF28C
MSLKTKTIPRKTMSSLTTELVGSLKMKANAVKTTPGHGQAGRHPTRELLDTLSGHKDPGMFGRMFPKLEPLRVSDAKLEDLAKAMVDSSPGSPDGNNDDIPSGFTYLGQFVDHDISLDMTSLGDKEKDPLGIENFRTPSLDLDAIYGLGPDGSPHLYARNPDNKNKPGPKFLIGKNFDTGEGAFRNDLPRNPEGRALIGDHRNDENLLVAQTHLAFLKFHNKVCDIVAGSANPPDNVFMEARRMVTWHYQWMILHDFVERLCGDGIVAQILHDGRKFYRFKRVPYMPVEFSAAAYRLGHSMVRQRYPHNRIFTGADFDLFFGFSGLSGQIVGDLAPVPPTGPLPVSTLPSNWIIDWRRFFKLGDSGGAPVATTPSRKIDPYLVPALAKLPGEDENSLSAILAFRNLKRGVTLGLPSGQDVAAAMRIKNPLTPDEIASDSGGSTDGAVAKQHGMHTATPLWYYILKEAKVRHDGKRLGPVGATIISEVFVGLVHGDHASYLWQRANWKPTLPSAQANDFTMVDLLRLVDDINPLGD